MAVAQKPIGQSVFTTPESNRHKRPWRDGSHTPLVPLLTPDPKGQIMEGVFRIPARLATAQEHTNEFLELDRIVKAAIAKWDEYKGRLGWKRVSNLQFSKPYDPPESDSRKAKIYVARMRGTHGVHRLGEHTKPGEEEGPDTVKMITVWARFQRTAPLYMKLEDALAINDLAKAHGIDLNKDFQPVNNPKADAEDLGEDGESEWVHPLEHAEKRRQRKGLKREDYLLGSGSTPGEKLMEPL